MTEQELFFDAQVRAGLRPQEQVLQHAFVTKVASGNIAAGVYFAVWTDQRMILVLTKRDVMTHQIKALNLGSQDYPRPSISQLVSNGNRLALAFRDGMSLELEVDPQEAAGSRQADFLAGVAQNWEQTRGQNSDSLQDLDAELAAAEARAGIPATASAPVPSPTASAPAAALPALQPLTPLAGNSPQLAAGHAPLPPVVRTSPNGVTSQPSYPLNSTGPVPQAAKPAGAHHRPRKRSSNGGLVIALVAGGAVVAVLMVGLLGVGVAASMGRARRSRPTFSTYSSPRVRVPSMPSTDRILEQNRRNSERMAQDMQRRHDEIMQDMERRQQEILNRNRIGYPTLPRTTGESTADRMMREMQQDMDRMRQRSNALRQRTRPRMAPYGP